MKYTKSITLFIIMTVSIACLRRSNSNNSTNTGLLLTLLRQASNTLTSFTIKPVGIKEMEITFPKNSYKISDKFSFNVTAKSGTNQSKSVSITTNASLSKFEGITTNKAIIQVPTFEFGTNAQIVVETDASNASDSDFASKTRNINFETLNKFIGYLKAKKPSRTDHFGSSIAISNDGETVAIGVPGDDGSTNGVNSDDGDDSMQNSGAVYIYKKDKATSKWVQEAYLKAQNAGKGDEFGFSVALSDDGEFLAVGAPGEDNDRRTEAGDLQGNKMSIVRHISKPKTVLDNNVLQNSGAVYLFRKMSGVWEREFYVKPTDNAANDRFGASVSLSDDGRFLAVGAPNKSVDISNVIPADTGRVGVPAVPAAAITYSNVGAAYIFENRYNEDNHNFWDQLELIPTARRLAGVPAVADLGTNNVNDTTLGPDDLFGTSIHIARKSNTRLYVFVGAPGQGRYRNPRIPKNHSFWLDEEPQGRVHVFVVEGAPTRTDATSKLRGAQAGIPDANRRTITVAAAAASTRTNAGNDAAANTTPIILSSNSGKYDDFGSSISSNSDGTILVIGAPNQDSNSVGGSDDNRLDSGVAYVFVRGTGDSWTQAQSIKSASDAGDKFGTSVFINNNASRIAVSAPNEDSSSVGLGGNQDRNDLQDAGAVYVFDRVGTTNEWKQSIYLKSGNPSSGDNFGTSIAFSGNTIAVGAPGEDGSFGLSTYLGNGNIVIDNKQSNSGAVYLY